MRVDPRNRTSAPVAESGKFNRNPAVQTATAPSGKNGDRVVLSSTLETLARAIAVFGSERAGRVPALAAQYRSGSHHADSAATAGRMVSEALLAEG